MLKLAVLGAQTLLGRELVGALETRECSVLPLATGPMSPEEEEGDLVVFAPVPALLEGLDLVILADSPQDPELLTHFPGRLLDLRQNAPADLEPMPWQGGWAKGVKSYKGRPALEQVIGLLPKLIKGFDEVSGTYLRPVGHLGDVGVEGLMEQTVAILEGKEPDTTTLGYRAAFEAIPQVPRGQLVEVSLPVFHGDLLILQLRALGDHALETLPSPQGVKWVEQPPSSRDVAVSAEMLAYFQTPNPQRNGTLILGFDPILWGVLRPTLDLLAL